MSNSIYGGVFDLANGNDFNATSVSNYLKFATLFFENMVIVDSWFTTPNPLTTHLKSILENKTKSVYNSDVVSLIKSGFIKPALRLGESMYENWEKNAYGIGVGRYAGFNLEDGKKILEFVESKLPEENKYVMWPESMGKAENTDYPRLINEYLISEKSNLTLKHTLLDHSDPKLLNKDYREIIDDAESLRLNFIQLIESNKSNPYFRRGDIEDLIKAHFNAKDNKNVFDYIIKNKFKDLSHSLAHYILDSVSTIYEIYHSNQFSTIGGLLPFHNDDLIENDIYKRITKTQSFDDELELRKKAILVDGNLNLTNITIDSIIKFKRDEEELISNYQDRVIELQNCSDLKEFIGKRDDLIKFIAKKYLPKFFSSNQSAGIINSVSDVTGNVMLAGSGGFIAYQYIHNGLYITIANNPYLFAIFGLAGFIKATPAVLKIKDRVMNYIQTKKFSKNNYSVLKL